MRDPLTLFIHLIATLAKVMRPGGARAVVAESLLLKHQLVILNRGRERAGPSFDRSRHCRAMYSLHSSIPAAAYCQCTEALHPPRFPRNIGAAQIPTIVLHESARLTRSQGAFSGAYLSYCRDQETEPKLGLSPDRTATLSCVWARDR